MTTVSAAVKLMPRPPARVHSRNTNRSDSENKYRFWNNIRKEGRKEEKKEGGKGGKEGRKKGRRDGRKCFI